jgi:simple sugar transport system ATP-binding protein
VDIAAAQFIRNAMADLARQGSAVIMISQDLEEIFEIAHSIAVLNEGKLSEIFESSKVTAEQIGLLMGESHDLTSGQIPPKTNRTSGKERGAS